MLENLMIGFVAVGLVGMASWVIILQIKLDDVKRLLGYERQINRIMREKVENDASRDWKRDVTQAYTDGIIEGRKRTVYCGAVMKGRENV